MNPTRFRSPELSRRDFLQSVGVSTGAVMLVGCGSDEALLPATDPWEGLDLAASAYGHWARDETLPTFVYTADHTALPFAEWDRRLLPPTRLMWHLVGNRAIQLQALNDGTVALFDESEVLRWLVAADDDGGTGVSLVEDDDRTWGSAFASRPPGATPVRTFGPTWFSVSTTHRGLSLERTVLCPEGEMPWVLVRVRLELAPDADSRPLVHEEKWRLRPRFLSFFESETRRQEVSDSVSYDVTIDRLRATAAERFAPDGGAIGAPATLRLEALGSTEVALSTDSSAQPTLRARSSVSLEPGQSTTLWFRFGRADATGVDDPAELFDRSRRALVERLPQARSSTGPEAALEIPWHAAALSGGAARDPRLGGHTLDQASTYSHVIGFNAAVRDPLQHALPLVYYEPDLALSVLKNVCAWGSPDGDLPYALSTDHEPISTLFRPSDSNLWTLWLAAEYAAVTGDLASFDELVPFHPSHGVDPVPMREHLKRQLSFFENEVGRGARDHVRILNADWNDLAIDASGVPPEEMIERGSSVLNSAMAAWVLAIFAGLATRLGESEMATRAKTEAERLRLLVADAWNGEWFHRAYARDGTPVGDDACWLEVQPWAILCGATTREQAASLARLIDERHRLDAPLGARVIWPSNAHGAGGAGTGVAGGAWYSINMTLVWALTRVDMSLAWDEWRRMTLSSHTKHYPEIWEGTLSGPDAWNSPESDRPGRTWTSDQFSMQAFPVSNLHSHAQPIISYLRLLGLQPTTRGSLAVGSGGSFSSRTLSMNDDGSGRLTAIGDVTVETIRGTFSGGPGQLAW